MTTFTIYPAIDLRDGKVVRLKQGDPSRQTVYSEDPSAAARRWLDAGAEWLHVVNLDGAFGEQDQTNLRALHEILGTAAGYRAQVQFGGGLRSLDAVRQALDLGVSRCVLGTALVEQPEMAAQAIESFGAEKVAAGLDARDRLIQVRGWTQPAPVTAGELVQTLIGFGLRWLIYTDISRDGIGAGLNIAATAELLMNEDLHVIASGGVSGTEDVIRAHQAGFSGVIIGRALYEGTIDLATILARF